jgi:hypothetical protein
MVHEHMTGPRQRTEKSQITEETITNQVTADLATLGTRAVVENDHMPASLFLGLIRSKPYTGINSFPRTSSRKKNSVFDQFWQVPSASHKG